MPRVTQGVGALRGKPFIVGSKRNFAPEKDVSFQEPRIQDTTPGPVPHSVGCTVAPAQAATGVGVSRLQMHSPWGMGGGLPSLWPGSSYFLWTGVLTLAPPTTLPNRNPHPLAPAPFISQKPPLSCSAKNLGLAGSCGEPLECRFPVPAPVCQPWQSPQGRMGDHRISSGTGRLEAMSHGGEDRPACLISGWGVSCTPTALNYLLALHLPSLPEWGSGSPSNTAPHHTLPSSCSHPQCL